MKAPFSTRPTMRQRTLSRKLMFPVDFQLPSRNAQSSKQTKNSPESLFDAWLASREIPGQKGEYLVPGTARPLTLDNARLAWFVTQSCTMEFLRVIFDLNPMRTTLMMTLNIIRSLFPAFRSYSQAMIVDELQSLIASHSFTWSRLLYLLSSEVLRRVAEGYLDSLAAHNENIVLGSARFFIEYKYMEQRVRLDVPTLADPVIRVLLRECEIFTHSFGSSGMGILDFFQILSGLTEICSHIFLLISLTRGANLGVLLLSICSVLLPILLSWITCASSQPEPPSTAKVERAAHRQDRLRNLAYSDAHRPEVALFGLGDWILKSWSSARKVMLSNKQPQDSRDPSILDQFKLDELIYAIQKIPFLLMYQHSSATLGSLTVYQSSLQALLQSFQRLTGTVKQVFQGIFLMSAFAACMKLKPKLNPKHEDTVQYISTQSGVSIEARGLSYTYPNSTEPALRNATFSLKSGESLAIVGFNGSGKSTLAQILLRIIDHDKGTLLVNGNDIRRYQPAEFHSHVSAVFQGFSKFNSTVKENIGLGNVDKISYKPAIENAVRLAEADTLVESLPYGLKTMLQSSAFDFPYGNGQYGKSQQDLSGGEWQRVALARAFMRANEPEVDMLLFDEPTSALDAHAQNQIFDTLDKISRSPSGERKKTVIFITHRLSTARRADKVAMMENGTISEFGSHEELLSKNGSYAALYRASL